MRRAFLADTEYQTFNLLHFYDHLDEKGDADFYLCDYFRSARNLYQRIPEEFAFSNMILFAPHEPGENEGRFHWYIRHAGAYLSPKKTVISSILEGNAEYSGYDEIYACTMTVFVTDLLQLNPQAKLYLIDEGVGGYAGDPLTGHLSWRQRLFAFVFKRGAAVVKPECVFMYQVENAKKHTNLPVREMPHLNKGYLKKAGRIFGTGKDQDIRLRTKLIWLTHPAGQFEKSTEPVDQKINDLLKQYKDQLLVRKHPRDDRSTFYQEYTIDHSGQMWELMLPLMDTENITLIAAFSTAQMTPKILYDMEPRVLFLCPLYKDFYGMELYEEIVVAIREFQELYRKPDRVILIEDLKMLQSVLEESV